MASSGDIPSSVSPQRIFETFHAHQKTAALKGALELDLFTAAAQGDGSAEDIAARCGATTRGIRILSDFLVVIGLLTKEDGRYRLTPDSAVFLDRRSPKYLGAAAAFLTSPEMSAFFRDVASTVRGSGIASNGGTVSPDNPIWVEYAKGMAGLMLPAAQTMARATGASKAEPWKILDIAAGHGMFGIHFARENPNARIVALDWPNVLAVARENARAAGVEAQFSTLAGSAFDVEFGEGYDLVLVTNFLHHFDRATCVNLLRKVHRALKEDGRAVTLEFVPNEDRVTPPFAAAFSFTMMQTTPAGDAYTLSDLDAMFRDAGFPRSEMLPVEGTEQSVVVSYKQPR